MDEGKEVLAVFCDISKAFDRVWHRGLISKLPLSGISSQLLFWLNDYLSDRKQFVVLSGTTSDTVEISAGVPQGSIIVPILFLVFINEYISEHLFYKNIIDSSSCDCAETEDTDHFLVSCPLYDTVLLSKVPSWA